MPTSQVTGIVRNMLWYFIFAESTMTLILTAEYLSDLFEMK